MTISLPAAVLARALDAVPTVALRGRDEEVRRGRIELRANEDGTIGIEGYATTFETPYDVAGGPPYGWAETIARGAFTKALSERDDTRLLINHDGVPVARTKSGTLTLTQDDIGLHVAAPSLDLRNPTVQELQSAMDRGDIDEMSFAFRVTQQQWDEDYVNRRITELRLFDVAIVTYPANPATHVQLNAVEDELLVSTGMGLRRAQLELFLLRSKRSA